MNKVRQTSRNGNLSSIHPISKTCYDISKKISNEILAPEKINFTPYDDIKLLEISDFISGDETIL
jgi:hypothetical protein